MAKLIFIMGKSSTGKDSIYNLLLTRSDLSLKRVVPYTTRPIRDGETDGVDYIFCDRKHLESLAEEGKVIEVRTYPTQHGPWDYFTIDDDQIDWTGPDMIMIGTLESYQKLKEFYKNREIIPIYIEVEDGVRLQRAIDREKTQDNPKYEELCRRFLADSIDFSEEKLTEAGITKRFSNDCVENTVNAVACYIKDLK